MSEEQQTQITVLTQQDKEFLKSRTPYVLPDNPSDKKWSASQIKAKMYEGFFVLYEWLKKSAIETNQIFHGLISGSITINGVIESAVNDSQGNVIHETYETKAHTQELITALQIEISDLIDTKIVGYVELEQASGTLTDEQYAQVQKNCCVVVYLGNIYYKSKQDGSKFQLATIYQESDKTYIKYGVLQIDNEKNYVFGDTQTASYYTANQIDTLLDDKVPKSWVCVEQSDIDDLF